MSPLVALLPAVAVTVAQPKPYERPVELYLGIGGGNAVCDDQKPDSDCPVDRTGTAVIVGGGWRFHRRASVGLELGTWQYRVRDSWRGQLADPATSVKFASAYFAPYVRLYWLALPSVDAFVQAGVGVGSVKGEAENAGGTYAADFGGVAFPVAVGAEWRAATWFRIGPNLGAYLHRSTQLCETKNGEKTCAAASRDAALLAWRMAVTASFVF